MPAPFPTATRVDPVDLHLPPTQPIDITHLLAAARTVDESTA